MALSNRSGVGMLAFFESVIQDQIPTELCVKWMEILEKVGFSRTFRQNYDSWFQVCFRSWDELRSLGHDHAADRKQQLFAALREAVEERDGVNKVDTTLLKLELAEVENKFGDSIVDVVIQCVQREEQLIQSFIQSHVEPTSPEEDLDSRLASVFSGLQHGYQNLQETLDSLIRLDEQYRNTGSDSVIVPLQDLQAYQKDQMNVECEELPDFTQLISGEETVQLIIQKQNESVRLFEDLLEKVSRGSHVILNDVIAWRNRFKLHYAELDADEPKIDVIAEWCAKTGSLIYDLKTSLWPKLDNQIIDDSVKTAFKNRLDTLFIDYMQGSFLVCKQDNYVLRRDSKKLKVNLRLLAADHLSSILMDDVRAYLVSEADLNNCCEHEPNQRRCVPNARKLAMKTVGFEGTSGSAKFTADAGGKVEVVFKGMKIKNFQRPESGRQIHEERYQIVFVTEVEHVTLWTLSLPLVITTGSNQQCHSLASVTWACYSSDVYSLPVSVRDELPLAEVVAMLEAKTRTLCASRGLTEDNKQHLKARLIGSDTFTDETPVTLQKFCFERMKQPKDESGDSEYLGFSFWQWFVACCNLVEQFLLPYWKEGLIVGFISKRDAKERLCMLDYRKCGTFILRFSDTFIVHSQGLTKMYAHLRACLLYSKTNKAGEQRLVVCDSVDVAGHRQLDLSSLAFILEGSRLSNDSAPCYRYVYPTMKRREDTFDKHIHSKNNVGSYRDVKAQWCIDVDQEKTGDETHAGKRTRSMEGTAISAPSKRTQATCRSRSVDHTRRKITGLTSNAFQTTGSDSVDHHSLTRATHAVTTSASEMPSLTVDDINALVLIHRSSVNPCVSIEQHVTSNTVIADQQIPCYSQCTTMAENNVIGSFLTVNQTLNNVVLSGSTESTQDVCPMSNLHTACVFQIRNLLSALPLEDRYSVIQEVTQCVHFIDRCGESGERQPPIDSEHPDIVISSGDLATTSGDLDLSSIMDTGSFGSE
ncbi:signal transducer and activator of transcription 5B-like [Dreissena polymorpha]|nr:signal transducer and activator of transcription 5B-like [Dreissena polymorpha]